MTVLHIISSMDPRAGGVSQAVRTIISGAEKKTVLHEVVCLDDPGVVFNVQDDFTIHRTGPGKTPWFYSSSLRAWLDQNIHRYDTLIIHGLWQYHTYAVYHSWKKNKKRNRLLVMPHGMLDPYFQQAKGRKLKALRNRFFWQFNERKVVNEANGLLFTCDVERILAKKAFNGYSVKNEFVVGLGVDTAPVYDRSMANAFFSSCEGLSKDAAYFLFLGRIHPKKGVDILVNVYKKLRIDFPGIPSLVIAGPGLETEYGKAIQQNSSGENIFFPGMLSGKAKWGAFYHSDLFVLPSHQENFGIAVVESLACKKPVLITDKVNIYQEIQLGGGGLVANDTEESYLALLKVWLNKTALEKSDMASLADKTFQQYFSAEVFQKNITQVVNK